MFGNHFCFAALKPGAVLLVPAVIAALSGCGDSGRVPTYAVEGKVTFPDGPLEGGQITFRSVERELSATGAIQPDLHGSGH